ncbi:MAG: hypothetical protein ACYDD4_03710 [Acidimicrobiales bacterium]
MSTVADESSWLTLDAQARQVGAYAFAEHGLFVVMGQWAMDAASDPSTASAALALDLVSSRHAWHSAMWRRLVPVRTGVDDAGVVAGSKGLVALLGELHSITGPAERLGLAEGLQKLLAEGYRRHMDRCSPAADGPVSHVLQLCISDLAANAASLARLDVVGAEASGRWSNVVPGVMQELFGSLW